MLRAIACETGKTWKGEGEVEKRFDRGVQFLARHREKPRLLLPISKFTPAVAASSSPSPEQREIRVYGCNEDG